MRTSPEKRNPSGSKELSGAKKFGALVTAAVVSVEALFVGACGAKDNAIENSGSETTQSATPSSKDNAIENSGSETTQSATPSSTWTPNIHKKTKAPTYEKPNGAIDAKEAIDEFFANNTVESILERRRSNNPEDIKWARDMTLALTVEAMESQEMLGLATAEESKGDNWLFRDIHKMSPEQLVDALDRIGYIGVAVTEKGYTVGGHFYQEQDKDKAMKTIALGYGPDSEAIDATLDFYKKETGELAIAQWSDPKDSKRTATILRSEVEQVGDESIEVITVEITGSPEFPGQTITRQYYLMPMDTLYGIDGGSPLRVPSLDPEDYNRPVYSEELKTYVTKAVEEGDVAGEPIRIPVLKQRIQ